MVMTQIPALFKPLIRSVNANKASIVSKPSRKKCNNKKGSVHEQKKNDATKRPYLLRTNEEKKVGTRVDRIC